MTLLREARTLQQKKFCSESRDIYHIGPTATCSHKDHCTILSVDTAARWCSILRALHSIKGISILKNNVSLPPIYYYTGEDKQTLLLILICTGLAFLTYNSLKQPRVRQVGSAQRKQDTTFTGSYVLHRLSFIIKQDPFSSGSLCNRSAIPEIHRHSISVGNYLIL